MTMTLAPGAVIVEPREACPHQPACPPAAAPDHDAARVVDFHPEQGWERLCNGVILFDDTGELSPSGRPTAPHRPEPEHTACAL